MDWMFEKTWMLKKLDLPMEMQTAYNWSVICGNCHKKFDIKVRRGVMVKTLDLKKAECPNCNCKTIFVVELAWGHNTHDV